MLCVSLLPPEIHNLLLFITVGSVSAALSTMAKAGFGGGIGLLATPLMVIACGDNVPLALGIMLPMLVISDYVILTQWWRKWNTQAAMSLMPGAILGMLAAWWLMAALQQQAAVSPAASSTKTLANSIMMIAIGVIAIALVILQVIRQKRGESLPFRPVLWQATSVGTIAGLTSTMAHAAGPIVTMFLLPQRMDKQRFVATTALFYWFGNQIKLVPYWFLGMLSLQTLGANLVLAPSVIAGAFLGVYLHHKLDERQFQWIVYVLVTLTGLDLILKPLLR